MYKVQYDSVILFTQERSDGTRNRKLRNRNRNKDKIIDR